MLDEFYEDIGVCPICGTKNIILKRRSLVQKQREYYINGMPKNRTKMDNIIDSAVHLCSGCGYVDSSFDIQLPPVILEKEKGIIADPQYCKILNSKGINQLMKKVLLYLYKYKDNLEHIGVCRYFYWLSYRERDKKVAKYARELVIDFYRRAIDDALNHATTIPASLYEKRHFALMLADAYRQSGRFFKAQRALHIFWAIDFKDCGKNGMELKKMYKKEKRAIKRLSRLLV